MYGNHKICFAGTKAVAAAMKKLAHGTVKDMGTKWFSELSDKGLVSILS